jgi:hypothetical protein
MLPLHAHRDSIGFGSVCMHTVQLSSSGIGASNTKLQWLQQGALT